MATVWAATSGPLPTCANWRLGELPLTDCIEWLGVNDANFLQGDYLPGPSEAPAGAQDHEPERVVIHVHATEAEALNIRAGFYWSSLSVGAVEDIFSKRCGELSPS